MKNHSCKQFFISFGLTQHRFFSFSLLAMCYKIFDHKQKFYIPNFKVCLPYFYKILFNLAHSSKMVNQYIEQINTKQETNHFSRKYI